MNTDINGGLQQRETKQSDFISDLCDIASHTDYYICTGFEV